MKFARKLCLLGALVVSATTGHSVDTTTTTASSRNLQSSSSSFTNPRAPSRRTPDGVAEPNSISVEELQALLLSNHKPGGLASNNREGGGENDDDSDSRKKFLLFVILLPTLALVVGAYVLFRVRKTKTRDMTEAEGLFQTQDETQQQEQPYQDVPKQGFAERRPNVI